MSEKRTNDAACAGQNEGEPRNLEQLLRRIDQTAKENEQVSVRKVMDMVGRRAFGPILLTAGIIVLAPVVGDIPGVPTTVGLIVIFTAVQLPLRRGEFWLPGFILDRSVNSSKIKAMLKYSWKPARLADKFIRPRLRIFTSDAFTWVIAGLCVLIALVIPVLETIPFSANLAGIALVAFGLALTACDGLLSLIAFLLTVPIAYVVLSSLI